jgi:hypothetical protein
MTFRGDHERVACTTDREVWLTFVSVGELEK